MAHVHLFYVALCTSQDVFCRLFHRRFAFASRETVISRFSVCDRPCCDCFPSFCLFHDTLRCLLPDHDFFGWSCWFGAERVALDVERDFLRSPWFFLPAPNDILGLLFKDFKISSFNNVLDTLLVDLEISIHPFLPSLFLCCFFNAAF